MITLYDMPLSGNCHKVRLLLSLLSLPYQIQPVDLAGGEQRSPDYLQRNPFGQVPVLDDDGLVIRDSQAIWSTWPNATAANHGGRTTPTAWRKSPRGYRLPPTKSYTARPCCAYTVNSAARSTRKKPGKAPKKCWALSTAIWKAAIGWPAIHCPSPISPPIPTWRWRWKAVSTSPPRPISLPGFNASARCPVTSRCRACGRINSPTIYQ